MNEMDEHAMTPDLRAFDEVDGTPAVLGDGREWLLADGGLWNALDEARDRIDDASRLRGEVSMADVRWAALVLLRANYELTQAEAAGLVLGAEDQPLADAVAAALFGVDGSRKTYTLWAYSALVANGIDPAKVPGAARPAVLAHLVASGRAIPSEQFIDSATAAKKLARFREIAARQAEKRGAEATPPGPEELISGDPQAMARMAAEAAAREAPADPPAPPPEP